MGKFQPGQSGNPSGRPKKSKNRTSAELQQALLRLLDKHLDELSGDLKTLKAKDRAALLISLAKHITPPALNPERLTEEQLTQIVEFLQKQKK